MTKVVICDMCGQRLDTVDVEEQERHITAVLRFEQAGNANVEIERDFCVECAHDKRVAFEAAPFTDSLERRSRPVTVDSPELDLERRKPYVTEAEWVEIEASHGKTD